MGLEVPRAGYARSMTEAVKIAHEIGFPVMVRPSFILGGGGTGIAADERCSPGCPQRAGLPRLGDTWSRSRWRAGRVRKPRSCATTRTTR